ncbi:MAG TPA: DMT family transporter [Azoarcus taiwanensis]|nr:DMT family transporter [Azoarcus taiwanensis]
MDWFALALLCALNLATADALTKRLLVGYGSAELMLVRFVVTAALLSPLLLVAPPAMPEPAFWLWVALAMPLEVLAMMLYMQAIRESPLALTLPYLAFTPVFATLTAFALLGETVTSRGLLGIALVVIGAYALNLEQAKVASPRSWFSPLTAIARERGSRLMLTVAVIYSITSVLGKGALQYMPGSQFGPVYFIAVALFAVAVVGWRQPAALAVLWRPRPAHWLIGSLMALMVITHFMALERVEVAYMISVKRTSILFGILLGAWLFAETRLFQHLFAAGLMVTGVALIVL